MVTAAAAYRLQSSSPYAGPPGHQQTQLGCSGRMAVRGHGCFAGGVIPAWLALQGRAGPAPPSKGVGKQQEAFASKGVGKQQARYYAPQSSRTLFGFSRAPTVAPSPVARAPTVAPSSRPSKRLPSPGAPGPPVVAKRLKRVSLSAEEVRDRVDECDMDQLALHMIEALTTASLDGQDYLDGNQLMRVLQEKCEDVVARVRTALGGKGWLRKAADQVPEIVEVEMPPSREPSYQLVHLVRQPEEGGFDKDLAQDENNEQRNGQLSAALDELPVELPTASPSSKRRSWASRETPESREVEEVLIAVALEALTTNPTSVENGYLSGSELSAILSAQHPSQVKVVRNALGGKGWLKRLFDKEPAICEVEAGKGEPCFARASQDVGPLGRQMMGKAAVGGGCESAAGTAGVGAADAVDFKLLCDAAVLALQDGVEFLEGGVLANILSSSHPQEVVAARRALGRKGWLKKLFQDDLRLQQVAVDGVDGACFACTPMGEIGWKGTKERSKTVQRKEAKSEAMDVPSCAGTFVGERSKREPREKSRPLQPEEVLERISEDERRGVTEAVVDSLQGKEYLEGNKVVTLLKERCPELLARVKEALGGKGWLKALLQCEPSIVQVEVDGRGEPCYTLVSDECKLKGLLGGQDEEQLLDRESPGNASARAL